MDKLLNRLPTLPWILAGPILRRVTETRVTVWVALKEPALVTLTVMDDTNHELASANRPTVAIGANLHIVAVTVFPYDDLKEGSVYQYNLELAGSHEVADLASATNFADLAYAPYKLPTFVLPPKDLNHVRLFHGSCRKPHGDGADALALLDPLIKQTASNALDRPHQLLLTGDQIYADDVADALLVLLAEAGDALLGWMEMLPDLNPRSAPLPPYWRIQPLSDAGFTSVDLRCHLMSLGEYLAMYLFVWSDVLWPKDPVSKSLTLPTVDDINKIVVDALDAGSPKWIISEALRRRDTIINDSKDLGNFYSNLGSVRKVLANIPTYMICDDHEVTDDWNMTVGFCRGVYGHPVGRRVVQNALVAYALCQHWGNTPEQFSEANQALPGTTLLKLLAGGTAATYDNNAAQIQGLVGIHDWNTQQNHTDKGVFHDPGALIYNYTIDTAGYLVIVTDTRTWRSYPAGNNAPINLLPPDQLTAQISNAPNVTGDKALLVVLTTNAPEIEALRAATRHNFISTHGSGIRLGDPHPDIYDSWELPSLAFDRLLARLTDKLPLDSQGRRHGSVILLSGDVHFGFASRLKYSATKRIDDGAHPQPAVAVFAQLVASSYKNESGHTRDIQRDGYRYSIPVIWNGGEAPEGYVGYDSVSNVKVAINGGHWLPVKNRGSFILGLGAWGLEGNEMFASKMVRLSAVPDFRYRLDYITAVQGGFQPPTPPAIPPIGPGATPEQRSQVVDYFDKATNFYRRYNSGQSTNQDIVGVNNISEITFHWGTQDFFKEVHHTLRYVQPWTGALWWTTYTISLDPTENTDYSDITALQEG